MDYEDLAESVHDKSVISVLNSVLHKNKILHQLIFLIEQRNWIDKKNIPIPVYISFKVNFDFFNLRNKLFVKNYSNRNGCKFCLFAFFFYGFYITFKTRSSVRRLSISLSHLDPGTLVRYILTNIP